MILARIALGFLLMSGAAVAQRYVISTIAGGMPPATPAAALNASIGAPAGIAADKSGNVYFSSMNCVFRIDKNGTLTVVAGTSRPGFSGDGGPAQNAQLNTPLGLSLDASGNLYIADAGNG